VTAIASGLQMAGDVRLGRQQLKPQGNRDAPSIQCPTCGRYCVAEKYVVDDWGLTLLAYCPKCDITLIRHPVSPNSKYKRVIVLVPQDKLHDSMA